MKGQALAIALVIAGGVAVGVMSLIAYGSLSHTRAQYYQQYQFADVFAPVKRAPQRSLNRLREIPGVIYVEGRTEGLAKLELTGVQDPVAARVMSLPTQGQPLVNRLFLRSGRFPSPERSAEAVALGAFADAHRLRPGDRFVAILNGRRQILTLTGIVDSPEFIYVIPPGGMLPDFQRYGVLWLSESTLAPAMDMRGAVNSIVAKVDRRATVAAVVDDMDRLLEQYGALGAYTRERQLSHRFLTDDLNQLRVMATVFPVIFMGVAMFLLHVVSSRLVSTQRDIIAVLKAFGYSNVQIGWHYSQLVLAIATLGLVLGVGIGVWLGVQLSELYREYYRLPWLVFRVNPIGLLLLVVITLLVAWLGGWRAIKQASALPPAEAMRPEGPAKFRLTGLERWFSVVPLTQPSRMIVRQLARRPYRTLLSMLGVAMASAIVLVGNFQLDSVALMVQTEFTKVQQQDAVATFVDPENVSSLHGLSRIPGVRYVEGRRSLPVKLVNGHREFRTVLSGIPQDARLQTVIDRQLQPVAIPEEGVLLTDFLARELRIQAGERIQIELLEGERKSVLLPVVGVTSEFLGAGAYMALTALNRAFDEGPLINQAFLNLDPRMRTSVYRDLEQAPGVLGISLRQAMLDSFHETLARTFLTFTFFNSLLGAIIAFGVIYNTVRISLAEKGRELASLRVLGYTHNEVAHILLGETAVQLVVGIFIGWWLGLGVAVLIVNAMQTELYRVPLTITANTLAISAAVVLCSALVSGALAWWRLKQLDLVAVLKTRE